MRPERRRRALLVLALLAAAALAGAAPKPAGKSEGLSLAPDDLRIEARADGGYDLYVRAKEGLASVLLTETTKDPAMKADNFAYRSAEYNKANGDEKRLLNGKVLPPAKGLYSLISSTPLPDASLGAAFRIFIPPVLVYGYPWSRSGTVAVGQGTYINIRAFAKPYADYSGPFLDNPYSIAISTRPVPPPEPLAAPAESVNAEPQLPPKEEAPAPPPTTEDDRTSSKIADIIDEKAGKSLDLVVCLDTTQSMEPYIDDLKKNLGPILRQRAAGFASFRIGTVLYKDYWPDEYITRKYPFTSDISVFERMLKGITVVGGKDIPEAEFEALYSAATEFDWSADRRLVIVVTDAPPHPDQRGKIAFADVIREAIARHLDAEAIVEPRTINPPKPAPAEDENEAKRLAGLEASGVSVKLLDGGAPRDFESDEEATKVAAEAGATHVIVSKTRALGPLGETVSRLVEAATGKELARDVLWRARSGGVETEFVNGTRLK